MKPENNRAPIGPENLPMPPAPNAERMPVMPAPETGIEKAPERVEQAAEARAAVSDMPVPATPTTPDPATTTQQPSTASPLTANDDDVIEKEWVDKAKDIVQKTAGDPHGRADQANALQKDYLQKRYGKALGATK